MPQFSRTRKFQFGLFVTPQAEIDTAATVATMIRLPAGSPQLALRLNKVGHAQAFVPTVDGQLTALPVTSFTGPPVWRLDVSPIRIDLHVDAQGYEDTAEKPLLLDDAMRRIVPNLARLCTPSFGVHRVALIVQLQADTPDASALVAGEFFSQAIQDQVASGDTLEVTARRNQRSEWKLGQRDTTVNRIETAEAQMQFAPSSEPFVLNWQFDVNTAPTQPAPYTGEAVEEFFRRAVEWVNARTRHIESH